MWRVHYCSVKSLAVFTSFCTVNACILIPSLYLYSSIHLLWLHMCIQCTIPVHSTLSAQLYAYCILALCRYVYCESVVHNSILASTLHCVYLPVYTMYTRVYSGSADHVCIQNQYTQVTLYVIHVSDTDSHQGCTLLWASAVTICEPWPWLWFATFSCMHGNSSLGFPKMRLHYKNECSIVRIHMYIIHISNISHDDYIIVIS